jgi:hypothetical protein
VRHINNLQKGSRCDGSGLNRHNAGNSDEVAYMFKHTCRFRRCRDAGGGNEDAGLNVHGMFENDVRTDIILEVVIYIPEHSQRDVNGTDQRSGRRGQLDATARKAVVSVPAPAPLASTLGQREGRSGSDQLGRRGQCTLSFASRCCDGRSRSTLL